jgi:DHA3 family macrolide efflux protein-like MFS transporter
MEKKEKLWTMNFLLLWQGQLVSTLGDTVYAIALGFWVLAVTGSTGLMGTLMAASLIPKLVISPFAGVIVDRADRKWMLVAMDLVRGFAVAAVGVAAVFQALQIWMVFAAGIVLGICEAFFSPSVSAAIPDIVPTSKLVKANSVFSMIFTGSNIVGSSAGGIIYSALGAPVMFLFNGLSFLVSGFLELFMKIPAVRHENQKVRFFEDMKEGFVFVWKFRGLRALILMAAFMNFIANIAIVLFLPMFQKDPALGPVKYGIAMAVMTGGMFIGMLFTSIVHIPYQKRFTLFMFCGGISTVCAAAMPVFQAFPLMLGMLAIFGMSNAVFNSFIMASAQQTVPQNMRGKVFALFGTVSQGLTPLGMAVGGILAEFLPIRTVICGSFLVMLAFAVIFFFLKSFKQFINFDPEQSRLEDIL